MGMYGHEILLPGGIYLAHKSDVRERIKERLGVLIGLPLRDAGRVVDLQWFSLGGPLDIADPWGAFIEARRRGEASAPPPPTATSQTLVAPGSATRTVGEYEVHVQCPWRLRRPGGIITGSRDRYQPAGSEPHKIPDGFDWKRSRTTRLDERVGILFAERSDSLRVESVQADWVGGFTIEFSLGYALDVFPDSTASREYWRLLRHGTQERQFVVGSEGITD